MKFYEGLILVAIMLIIYTYFIRGVPPREPAPAPTTAVASPTVADVAGNAVDLTAAVAHSSIALAADAATVLTGVAAGAATSAVQVVSDVATATVGLAKDTSAVVSGSTPASEHYANGMGYGLVDRGDNLKYGAPQGYGPAWAGRNIVGFEKADKGTFSQTLGRREAMQDAGASSKQRGLTYDRLTQLL